MGTESDSEEWFPQGCERTLLRELRRALREQDEVRRKAV